MKGPLDLRYGNRMGQVSMDDIEKIRHNKKIELLNKLQNGNSEEKKPEEISDGNFNEFISINKIVLVDCWAAWCGPCRMLEPTIEELASEYQGKAAVAKLNIDHNPAKSNEYMIKNIPTMLFFKNGKLADRMVGYKQKSEISSKLDRLLV